MFCSQKSFNDPDDQGKQYASDDHCGNRKIKPEVFSFYSYVTGKSSDPVEFVREKIYDDANGDNNETRDNNDFSCLGVCHCLYVYYPAGSSTVKVDPEPGALSTLIKP